MTDDLEVDTTPFCLEAIKEDDKAITFYTGFTSYIHLMICFNFLEPAVATLCYNCVSKIWLTDLKFPKQLYHTYS